MVARNPAYDLERQRLEQHNSNCLKDLAVRKLNLHCAAVCSCGDCRAQLVGAALRSAKPPSMNGGEAEPRDLWSHSTEVKQRHNPASRDSARLGVVTCQHTRGPHWRNESTERRLIVDLDLGGIRSMSSW